MALDLAQMLQMAGLSGSGNDANAAGRFVTINGQQVPVRLSGAAGGQGSYMLGMNPETGNWEPLLSKLSAQAMARDRALQASSRDNFGYETPYQAPAYTKSGLSMMDWGAWENVPNNYEFSFGQASLPEGVRKVTARDIQTSGAGGFFRDGKPINLGYDEDGGLKSEGDIYYVRQAPGTYSFQDRWNGDNNEGSWILNPNTGSHYDVVDNPYEWGQAYGAVFGDRKQDSLLGGFAKMVAPFALSALAGGALGGAMGGAGTAVSTPLGGGSGLGSGLSLGTSSTFAPGMGTAMGSGLSTGAASTGIGGGALGGGLTVPGATASSFGGSFAGGAGLGVGLGNATMGGSEALGSGLNPNMTTGGIGGGQMGSGITPGVSSSGMGEGALGTGIGPGPAGSLGAVEAPLAPSGMGLKDLMSYADPALKVVGGLQSLAAAEDMEDQLTAMTSQNQINWDMINNYMRDPMSVLRKNPAYLASVDFVNKEGKRKMAQQGYNMSGNMGYYLADVLGKNANKWYNDQWNVIKDASGLSMGPQMSQIQSNAIQQINQTKQNAMGDLFKAGRDALPSIFKFALS